MASNPLEYVINAVQPAVNALAAELVDVVFPDGTEITGIKATHPNERSQAETVSGVVIEVIYRTFTMQASDLGREPEHGMLITWRNQQYRAVPIAGGKAWDWQDHEQQRYRIHTELAPVALVQTVYGNAAGVGYGNAAGTGYGSAGN